MDSSHHSLPPIDVRPLLSTQDSNYETIDPSDGNAQETSIPIDVDAPPVPTHYKPDDISHIIGCSLTQHGTDSVSSMTAIEKPQVYITVCLCIKHCTCMQYT